MKRLAHTAWAWLDRRCERAYETPCCRPGEDEHGDWPRSIIRRAVTAATAAIALRFAGWLDYYDTKYADAINGEDDQ